MLHKTETDSPIGKLTLACDVEGENLVGLWIEGQKRHGNLTYEMVTTDDAPALAAAKNWLERYFAGERPSPSELSMAPSGSDFQISVWNVLLEIPYGEVTTYGAIARRLNRTTKECRVIGGAISRNPISIIIPCHRILSADGSLTGYAAGVPVKAKLLDHESGAEPFLILGIPRDVD